MLHCKRIKIVFNRQLSNAASSVHGRPIHRQTQGKIERYHITMKNVVKLDNYFPPEELEGALEKFVYRYNNESYHDSLNNLTAEMNTKK